VVTTQDDIENILADYENLNRTQATVQFHGQKLRRFHDDLPADKAIRYCTLQNWRESVLHHSYTPDSVNAAANPYLDFINQEHQLAERLKEGKAPQTELYCAQFPHLLQKARLLGKEIVCGQNKQKQILTVSACLKKEQLDFANKNGIPSGQIFRTQKGRSMHRTYVSANWEDS